MLNVIKDRVSYRGRYQDKKVPREHLIQIMEAGLAAPSGCNKQTTSLIAVDEDTLLADLKALIEPPIASTAPAWILVLTQKVYAYRDKCFYIQDYSAAIENMLLEITALGYESCWYEGHITDDDNLAGKLEKRLDLPSNYHIVCILPVGIAMDQVIHTKKKSFEKRAWFNRMGEEYDKF